MFVYVSVFSHEFWTVRNEDFLSDDYDDEYDDDYDDDDGVNDYDDDCYDEDDDDTLSVL